MRKGHSEESTKSMQFCREEVLLTIRTKAHRGFWDSRRSREGRLCRWTFGILPPPPLLGARYAIRECQVYPRGIRLELSKRPLLCATVATCTCPDPFATVATM